MSKKAKFIDFESITIRSKITSRGGGIEINLSSLGYPRVRMTAYQNYLGGGLLGAIGNDCSRDGWRIDSWRQDAKLVSIAEQLSRYFHSLTNHEDNEWESATFE